MNTVQICTSTLVQYTVKENQGVTLLGRPVVRIIVGWLDVWMVGWLDGRMVGRFDDWMIGWLDGRMVGW